QSRCTSLVCSCYVPCRYSDYRGEQERSHTHSHTISTYNKNKSKKRLAKDGDGVMEEIICNDILQSNGGTNGPHFEPTPSLKGNLKKSPALLELNQPRSGSTTASSRKVSWSDAHGKDIAHVQEFEASVSEDGRLEGVQNSCVCAIQ
ncbi:hypothetical protein NMG60_11017635, partial [Bertholletia excelsa]